MLQLVGTDPYDKRDPSPELIIMKARRAGFTAAHFCNVIVYQKNQIWEIDRTLSIDKQLNSIIDLIDTHVDYAIQVQKCLTYYQNSFLL